MTSISEFNSKLNEQVIQTDNDLRALRNHLASLRSDTMQYLDTIKLDETTSVPHECCIFESMVSTKFDIYLQQIDHFKITVLDRI